MNIIPKDAVASPTPVSESQGKPMSATARAIAAFNAANAAKAPAAPSQNPTGIKNASAVSPEEMGAITSGVEKPEEEQSLADVVEGQKDTSEPEKEEAKAEEEQPLSTQYAAMARKEKALRAKMQEFNREREEFKRQQEAFKSQSTAPSFDESKYIARDRLKTDTLAVLAEEGVSYEELTQAILNQGQVQQDPQTKAALAKLEAKIAQQEEAAKKYAAQLEEQQTNAYKQAINKIRQDAQTLVTSDPDFEIIKGTNSVNDVVELIETTWKEDGILLSVEEAAREVEKYLEEEAIKLTRLTKIQQKIKSAQAPAPKLQAPQAPKQTQPMKTLTNQVGASRPLTAKERAILAFKGELQK